MSDRLQTPDNGIESVSGVSLFSEPGNTGSPRGRERSGFPGQLPVYRREGALCCTLPPDCDGIKVLTALRNAMGLSYSAVVTLRHTENSVLADGLPVRTIDRLRGGQVLTVRLPEPPPQLLAAYDGGEQARVILEDDWVTVYDKPPRMPTHPAHSHQSDTLANLFCQTHPDCSFRAVGRLDADTSGLIAVARDGYTAAWLPGRIQKTYLAVTSGIPQPAEGVIDVPLLPLEQCTGGNRVSPEGLPAVTRYRVLAARNGLALVECRLETGRTHQIRAHLAHIGCPLVGDARYGGDLTRMNRHALHCATLSFPEPDGKRRELASPLPPDFLII